MNTATEHLAPPIIATVRDTPYRGARERAYVDWTTGAGIQDSGHRFTAPPRSRLADLLAAIPPDVRTVYLVGALPGAGSAKANGGGSLNAFLAWAMSDAGPEWMDDRDRLGGTYYHRDAPESSVLRLRHRLAGRTLDVRPFHSWGTDGHDPDTARSGLVLLATALRDHEHGGWFPSDVWSNAAIVLASPAVTGERLWRACIAREVAWPLLPDDLREHLHSTSGQHRIETFPAPAGRESLPDGMYALDGRFAYADALFGLGFGPAEVDQGSPVVAPRRAGWVKVEATVPADWQQVGLLPLKGAGRSKVWEYPAEPGRTFTTWAGTPELRVALWPFPHRCGRCAAGWQSLQPATFHRPVAPPCSQHGWRLVAKERIHFQTSSAPRGQQHPMDVFATRLRIVNDRLALDPDAPAGEVAARAVRHILLDTVGLFYRGSRRRTYSAPLGSRAIPNKRPFDVVRLDTGEEVALWEVPEPMPADAMSHPEFSVQIYSRVRARMLLGWQGNGRGVNVPTGMLTLPREQIVNVYGDALYLAADPGWPEDKRPGSLRVKEHLLGPLPWPTVGNDTRNEA